MTLVARCLVASLTALSIALAPASAPAQAQKDDQVFPMAPVEITSPWVVVPPSVKNTPKPPYPEAARARDQQGTVSLLIRVRPDGTVGEVRVRKSSGNASMAEFTVCPICFVISSR